MTTTTPTPTATNRTATSPTATTLAAELRARWPAARFRAQADTIRWVDGPARLDVHRHLARAGYYRSTLERAGPQLRRRLSRTVIAAVALQALELTGQQKDPCAPVLRRIAAAELDDLELYEIPPAGPVPLSAQGATPPAARHAQARALAAMLPTSRPVDPCRPTSWRPVLDRYLALVCQLDPAALQACTCPPHDPDRVALVVSDPVLDGPHPLTLAVALPAWPCHPFVAVTHPHQNPPTPQQEVELHWTDGPSPAQVTDHLAFHGWPRPFRPRLMHRAMRTLSPTATAAAVMLYRHLHAEPYRDDAAGYHWMARWRSATVRDIHQRWRFARDRLHAIEEQLRALPLPLEGPLPQALRYDGDGTALWRAAETLLAVTPHRASRPPTDPLIERARLPVQLAATYEKLGHDVLSLLHTPNT